MSCTRTGGHIYIRSHGLYAYGDCFESDINSVAYFRIVEVSPTPLGPSVHYVVYDYLDWFDRDDPITTLITETYKYLGYEGVYTLDLER